MSDRDPVEAIIKQMLDSLGVAYRRDDPLDFECEGFAIECKQFASPRLASQIGGRTDVIVIHGMAAARAFADLMLCAQGTGWAGAVKAAKRKTRPLTDTEGRAGD